MTKVIIVTQNFCPVNSTVHSGNLHLWKKNPLYEMHGIDRLLSQIHTSYVYMTRKSCLLLELTSKITVTAVMISHN